jgi:short-subunit dehydrogenase
MNILITGASAGLGLGMAREFAQAGHNLALCARRLDQLELIKADLLKDHPNITVLVKQLDVSHYADVSTVFNAFKRELGQIDRIIVNAGIGKGQALGTGRFDANLACAQTNFIGALAQCDAAMEIFRAQEYGHLVTVSSMAAFRGQPRSALTYAATKAALSSMSEGEHQDLWEIMLPAAGGRRRHRWPCPETSARRVPSTTRPACGSGSATAGAPHASSIASADAWRSAC